MKLRNQIFNYFVIPPVKNEMPRVVLAPVTMNSSVAKTLIEKQFKKEKKPDLPRTKILQVCFDYDSEMIYVPNSKDFARENMELLLKAAEVRITKDFGGFSSRPPIEGSPFSSLRVRSLSSFSNAQRIISEHYKGKKFKNIPVIEVYLPRMPTTAKSLPEIFKNEEFLGGYIGPSHASSVTFVEEMDFEGKKRKEPVVLLTQSTPFILINIAQTKNRKEPTATEREWVVLSGYRDYLYDDKSVEEEKYIEEDISKFADLYAIKRYLYLGWSFEEVNSLLFRKAKNVRELMNAIDYHVKAAQSLVKEGYKNVAEVPYYITFKIDDTSPLKEYILATIDPNTGKMDTTRQDPNFLLIDYDEENSYVLIETPAFISPDLCVKIFKAKNTPFISKYNPIVNKMDIKSVGKSFDELKMEKKQLAKIRSVIKSGLQEEKQKDLDFRSGDLASGISAINPNVYNVRKVSDYLYACDYINKMCKINNIPFKDFDVVIGPIEQKLGRGVQGGFMDHNSFVKSNIKIPYELAKGVWISPPVILINSVTMPSYAEQTETLIHEYRHYLYGLQNIDYKQKYGRPKQKRGEDYEHWYNYLTDSNERAAHKDEIKFELGLGKSYDEIVRNKVGGQITKENYPIAILFSQLVQEAKEEVEEEMTKDEKPT